MRLTDGGATINHDIIITHFRGHKSAKCSCGVNWTKVGYANAGELQGENDMLSHTVRYGGTILRAS